jgi:retinol-binding protein 3
MKSVTSLWPSVLSVCLVISLILGGTCGLNGQTAFLDSAFIKSTVQSVADVIHDEYFDTNLADRMAAFLRQSLGEGRYANVASPDLLASKLTSDLYSFSRDKHLSVIVAPVAVGGSYSGPGASQQSRADAVRISNAGVQRAEILPGNVGYLNITNLFHVDEAGDVIASAMHMLRHADALILDSRGNKEARPSQWCSS